VVELLADLHWAKLRSAGRALACGPSLVCRRARDPPHVLNDAGEAFASRPRYGLEPDHIVILQDELTCRATLKLKDGGGLAGNHGLRCIKAHLHSDPFRRVRIG